MLLIPFFNINLLIFSAASKERQGDLTIFGLLQMTNIFEETCQKTLLAGHIEFCI